MKHPLAPLHAKKHHVFAYLDDMCLWGDTPSLVQLTVNEGSSILMELVFSINWLKSVPNPSPVLTWLGIILNSQDGSMMVPPKYQNLIAQKVSQMLRNHFASRQELESLLGIINFAGQISPRARLLSHPLARPQLLSTRTDSSLLRRSLPQCIITALVLWEHPIFLRSPVPVRPLQSK